ncbi:MAG TPA: efflux RND transporter permease subunit, partial [Burkholderiales bacterium]|nr:efflux RND transporter permease subunit [Burkholderiales bacterium]
MWIVQLALRRPYTFIVLALLILIIGPLAILRTPTDIFPNINIPVVSTIWRYTGLSTEEMEGRIVTNYERAMSATVNDIARIESQTYNGIGVVKVFFHPSANLPASLAQIIAIAQTVIGGFPQGTVPPLILTYNASTVPILQLSLSSKSLGEHEIFDLANSFMRTQLATVQGAVMPYPYGGKFRSVMVDIDSRKLQSKNLSPLDVVNAVNTQNLVLPTGTAKIGEFEYNIGMNGSPKTIAELNDLPIKTGPAGTIYIRDVAQVHDGFQPQTNIVRHDGQRAVLVNILKYGTASTLDIVDRVKAELPKMQAGLPPDLITKIATDQSIFVRAAVDGVIHEAILAGCLTALMILLFLGSWRSTLIIAVTIPLAILTSIIALFALGETINIMTLGGLALAVGILVDDATVAIENISQHLEQDKALDQAILDGAQQIAIPTFVSTLAICIVFVPMFLLTGVARYLFVPLAEAVVFAMLASYVFSRTLVPTLAKYLLREGFLEHGHPKPSRNPFVRFHRAFEHGFEGFRDRYHGILERCMRHQKFFMILFLAACIGSGGLLPFVGRDFFPSVDAGQFKLHVRAKTGTRIEETARLCDLVESEIRQIIPASELATIIDNIGLPLSGTNMSYNMSGTLGSADADIQVSLNPGHGPTEHYMKELRQHLPERFPGLTFYFLPADIVSQILNFGLPAPIDVQVVGRNIEANRAFTLGLFQKLKQVDGIADLRVQQPADQPRLDINVDRTRAQQAGFSQKDVASNLLIALSGSFQTSPSFWLNPKNGVTYNIITQTPQYNVDSLQALANIPITGPESARSSILGDLATVSRGAERAVSSHWNVQPVLDIFGATQDRDLGGVADDVNKIVDASMKDLPKGSRLIVRGQIETMLSSFQGLLYGLIFAIVMVYLLMVVNFQSWLDPFIIITALPAALAGIVWMLFATGTTVSVPALTGAIMAMGIATANSILVVSFARERLQAGVDSVTAALDAGFSRFRPVLMTALAMIIGMVPMSLGLGEGGEQNAPLGRAVIGGLLLATVATLFFVPVVFAFIHGFIGRRRDAAASRQSPQPA